ncbi:MAG TPA: hypothetical protein VNH11_21720 [Pirellulales bacterium]|nr:hypothetical protein [Pirellulales bacterium]
MSENQGERSRSLSQTLAVQTQVHLPGTAGRLLKQIRDLERVAPLFVKSRLVRSVDRPKPLSIRVAGIATRAGTKRVAGGYLYAAAACRMDIAVQDNVVSTCGQDSSCHIDDIDYEDQAKRFQLMGVRQAYELADRALKSAEPLDAILVDCPLLLNRSMEAPNKERYSGYRALYNETLSAIEQFWQQHRERLFPWNPKGPMLAGIASERYGAIIAVAQQDLRTEEGCRHVLHVDELDQEVLRDLYGAEKAISGIGERRFIHGILGSFTRTAAFRMSTQTPRMEPETVMAAGVIGLHYAAGPGTPARLLELVGDEPGWKAADLDRLVGAVMALTVVAGRQAWPLPVQLAERELNALDGFLKHYRHCLHEEMKSKEIEDVWLSELDELN